MRGDRRDNTLDLLNAWTEIGVFPRLLVTFAIIAGVVIGLRWLLT